MDKYEIYSDGAYATSRNQGGFAFVVLKNGEKIYSGFDGVFDTTNNRMEIVASLEALKWLLENNIKEVTLYTDSMYLIGTMSQNWKRKKNQDLWEQMDEVVKDLKIEWKHVKGHAGDKYNDLCDTLAVHGSQLILQ